MQILDTTDAIKLPLELKDPAGEMALMKLTPETEPDRLISRLDKGITLLYYNNSFYRPSQNTLISPD